MSEFSKMVTQQMNHAEELKEALNTHKKRIFAGLAEALKPHMKEEEYNTFTFRLGNIFDAKVSRLDELTTQMGESDLAHSRELLQTQDARSQRELILKETFRSVHALKQMLHATHGKRSLALLGMAGETPRVPDQLKRWIENVITIAEEGIILEKPLIKAMPAWDADMILKFLRPVYEKLNKILSRVRRESQEDKDTLTTKWRLMEEQNYAYTAIASIAEAYARMAGDHKLGDRLRPRSITRPGRRQKQKDDDGQANSNQTSQVPSSPTPSTEPTPGPVA